MISGNDLIYRCKECPYHENVELPSVTKKILYIDQFALSNMVKPKADAYWKELHNKLAGLVAKNLIVCPSSRIHYDESKLSHGLRESLKSMYRSISGSIEFLSVRDIQKCQLYNHLMIFIGKSTDFYSPRWREFTNENPHMWSNVFQVHVDYELNEDEVNELRVAKSTFQKDMETQYEQWRGAPQSFETDVAANYASLRNSFKGLNGIENWLIECVKAAVPDEKKPADIVSAFIDSGLWRSAPYSIVWTHLWALIAELARNPKGGRKPQLGDYFDSQVLAFYAPYCDAMLLDKGFRDIAQHGRVNVEGRFEVKAFSAQTRDEFMNYLNGIEQNAPATHYKYLAEIYDDEVPIKSDKM